VDITLASSAHLPSTTFAPVIFKEVVSEATSGWNAQLCTMFKTLFNVLRVKGNKSF
jgi:hypothetical protein